MNAMIVIAIIAVVIIQERMGFCRKVVMEVWETLDGEEVVGAGVGL